MEKPMTLCDRCEKQFSCLLNYDGVPCRKNRTVEPTNYDRIISKTPEELARWIWAVQSEIKHEDLFSTDGWYIWLMQEAKEGET